LSTAGTWVFIQGLTVLSFFPHLILYAISDLLFLVLYYGLGYRKVIVRRNLRLSFPEKSTLELKKIEVGFYRHLADIVVETVKSISISRLEAMERYTITNQDLMENYYRAGRSVIAVAGHYGNWEMANILTQNSSYPCMVVYKPLTNRLFDDFLIKVRSRFGVEMVPMKNILRRLICLKNSPTMTVMVSDQTPAAVEISVYTQFLNQSTAVFQGVEKIAALTHSVVVFIQMKKVKRGFYTSTFVPVSEHPQELPEFELTRMHTAELERIIREKPEYWLWSHKRWKHNPSKIPRSVRF